MDLRLGLYRLAREHRLDAQATQALHRLAGLDTPPAGLERWLPRGVAVLAALLTGLGVVFWVAANWDDLGRFGRFALLQALVFAACAGVIARPRARAPLSLLALLATGALYAHFGQTYQTGADAWQLFALWAVLTLPLAAAARSDIVWAPWALVGMSGVALWVHAHTGHRWRFEPQDLGVHAAAWTVAALLVAALGQALSRRTGAGTWSRRTAATLLVAMVTAAGVGALFWSHVGPQYPLALVVLAGSAALHTWRPLFDVYTLSASALGVNVLLVGGLARVLIDTAPREPVGGLFLLGLVAATLLAATVTIVMRVSQRR